MPRAFKPGPWRCSQSLIHQQHELTIIYFPSHQQPDGWFHSWPASGLTCTVHHANGEKRKPQHVITETEEGHNELGPREPNERTHSPYCCTIHRCTVQLRSTNGLNIRSGSKVSVAEWWCRTVDVSEQVKLKMRVEAPDLDFKSISRLGVRTFHLSQSDFAASSVSQSSCLLSNGETVPCSAAVSCHFTVTFVRPNTSFDQEQLSFGSLHRPHQKISYCSFTATRDRDEAYSCAAHGVITTIKGWCHNGVSLPNTPHILLQMFLLCMLCGPFSFPGHQILTP